MKIINNGDIKVFDKEFYKQKILFLLRNDSEEKAKEIIKEVAKDKYINQNDIDGLYSFFSPLYDEIFYDLMFKKINVNISTKELLETLALPIFQMNEYRKKDLIDKLK